MKRLKVALLILVVITALITLYYTINRIIESKHYAIANPEIDSEVGNMGGRNGIRWRGAEYN